MDTVSPQQTGQKNRFTVPMVILIFDPTIQALALQSVFIQLLIRFGTALPRAFFQNTACRTDTIRFKICPPFSGFLPFPLTVFPL